MTEVFFYQLTDWKLGYALSLLLKKSLQNGRKVVVQCGSELVRDQLNEYLWTWKADSFLPHGVDVDEEVKFAPYQPVLLTVNSYNPNGAHIRFFIDNAHIDVDNIDYYERLVVMFDGYDRKQLESARDKWRKFKVQGYKLNYFKQNEDGYWERNDSA